MSTAFGIEVAPGAICILKPGMTKREALDVLVDAVSTSGVVSDHERFRTAVHEREAVMSTGIGSGVAIPHVRIDQVSEPRIGVGVSRSGLDYDTLDGEPVHVVVMFAMPSGSQREYLGLLAHVMTTLKAPGFRDRLVACKTPADVAGVLANFGE